MGVRIPPESPISFLQVINTSKCQTEIKDGSESKKFCSVACREESRESVFNGREKELIQNFMKLGSLNKAIKAMGLPGAMGGWYHQAKRIIDDQSKNHV